MNKQKFTLKLDFFTGFYESWYENSDTEYNIITDEIYCYNQDYPGINMEYDDLNFDYQTRRDDIVDMFIQVYKHYAPDVVRTIKFDHLYSPKYYNFETDEIYVKMTLTPNWRNVFKTFMSDNYEWLKNRIMEDWTSYDGFCSFMSNDIDEWDYHLYTEMDERYIGCIITYMMVLNHQDSTPMWQVLAEKVLDEISDGEYLSFNESGEEKWNLWTEKHDPAQMSLFAE